MNKANDNEISNLEALLRAGGAPKFMDAVTAVLARDADTVLLTLGAFAGEPELLYAALRYASLRGVSVTIAPQFDHAGNVAP